MQETKKKFNKKEFKDKYCKHKLIILDESDNMTEKVFLCHANFSSISEKHT